MSTWPLGLARPLSRQWCRCGAAGGAPRVCRPPWRTEPWWTGSDLLIDGGVIAAMRAAENTAAQPA
jgi:hypothetical protein